MKSSGRSVFSCLASCVDTAAVDDGVFLVFSAAGSYDVLLVFFPSFITADLRLTDEVFRLVLDLLIHHDSGVELPQFRR